MVDVKIAKCPLLVKPRVAGYRKDKVCVEDMGLNQVEE